ncbi:MULTISPECIES: hypothetical protein [unclassified Pseudoalteromonas]|uniref:hypothetical protein n=1 Tax=unclassified Pseudoalteromonas TaxID=194690 RepID=UPI002097AD8B|nr:hypothetical protein [Pseudoalteromonas sp. XMcav2-N]MCO7187603.1 hypothetical protein [Pseudoalteromonas sp. XMcav2-N]
MSWMSQMLFLSTLIAVGLSWKALTRGLKKDPYSMHFIIPLFLSVAIILIEYFDKFGFDPNNRNIKDWVDGAVYLNNMLTPILLLATIYLLYRTWLTSKQELAQTQDILRKKEDLELLRSRIQLLNKNLDVTPSAYLDFKASVQVLKNNSETNESGFLDDLHSVINRVRGILLKDSAKPLRLDAHNTFDELIVLSASVGNKAPTFRDIFSMQSKHHATAYLRLMKSGLGDRKEEDIKRILNNLVLLLYKETYFSVVKEYKERNEVSDPSKYQDMLVAEMAANVRQLIENSDYEDVLSKEYQFHFTSVEFEGLKALADSNPL